MGEPLHGSVITAGMPDAMCSLETFVADRVLWQESFFLASAERSLYKEERNGMNFLNAFVGFFPILGT